MPKKKKGVVNRTEFMTQYTVTGDGFQYRPVQRTVNGIYPGFYKFDVDNQGIFIQNIDINNSELLKFSDTIESKLIDEFGLFWTLKDEYLSRGEQHKRGYLLHGPPGGGKSSLISLLTSTFIDQGNVVFEFNTLLAVGLPNFRSIEPDRKIMVIIEDVDAYIGKDIEESLLQFLDGVIQHTNTVVIATTNYPEKLPGRIRNRPSRFDRVEKIDYPSDDARRTYAVAKAQKMTEAEIETMVADTTDFTFAHLKEIILAVEVYGISYLEVLERLQDMRKQEADSLKYEMRSVKLGFD